MREILFRGKRIDTGEWVEGDLARRKSRFAPQLNTIYGIANEYGEFCTVGPATVGQHTGLSDKNGKRIFEGDIVALTFGSETIQCVCKWVERNHKSGFFFENMAIEDDVAPLYMVKCGKVVGNIYDRQNKQEGLAYERDTF